MTMPLREIRLSSVAPFPDPFGGAEVPLASVAQSEWTEERRKR